MPEPSASDTETPPKRAPSPRKRARERQIRAAAVRLFTARGYEATTMRELAHEVGMDAGSLYNHVRSKADLLDQILVGTMEDLLESMRACAETAPSEDPEAELTALITAYVQFHADRLQEAAIADSERRSLEHASKQRLVELGDELANIFRGPLDRGRTSGAFAVQDTSMATVCILSICARLPVWYRVEGRLQLDEVAERIVAFALHGVVASGRTGEADIG